MENSESAEEFKLYVSPSPHIQKDESTREIMWLVVVFLVPSAIFGMLAFGWYAAVVVISAVFAALGCEVLCQLAQKKSITIDDGSAFLTGLLVGMNMPPTVPLYIPILSSAFAIVIAKHVFGGLGQNWANPAIAARVFALVAWSKHLTTWTKPFVADVITAATPLGAAKSMAMALAKGGDALTGATAVEYNPYDLFFGINKAGSIGELSIFLLVISALYLIYRGIINLEIPVCFIGTVAFFAWMLGGLPATGMLFQGDPLFHVLTGGLVLGALFMATDMVTTPITTAGRVIFGIGCGLITVLIRLYGGLPEGVSLSILFMNMLTPAIDRFIKVRPMGYMKKKVTA